MNDLLDLGTELLTLLGLDVGQQHHEVLEGDPAELLGRQRREVRLEAIGPMHGPG